jgi:hypothetical protein
MSSSRRLKLRSSERHSQHTPLKLVFARPDYDCRREIPRFEKWKAMIVDRFGSR